MEVFIAHNPGLTFLLMMAMLAAMVVISDHIAGARKVAVQERERTKRAQLKADTRKYKADARSLANWSEPRPAPEDAVE